MTLVDRARAPVLVVLASVTLGFLGHRACAPNRSGVHVATASSSASFDGFKKQMAAFETLRIWVGVEPPVPQGETTTGCSKGGRPWCPTGWIVAADAAGRLSANAVVEQTTYERTLVLDGQATTYVPGLDEQRPPNVALAMLLTRCFEFIRQDLQTAPYSQGSAEQLGLPTGLMGSRAEFFRVVADVGLETPVEISFGFDTLGTLGAVAVEVGGRITKVSVGGVELDQDLGADWFVPYAWPHRPPYFPPAVEASLREITTGGQ